MMNAPNSGGGAKAPGAANGGDSVRAGSPDPNRTPEEDGGTVASTSGMSGMRANTAGQGGAAACNGTMCECTADVDCAERMSGTKCVEGRCWAPDPQCEVDDDCVMRGPEYIGGRCHERQCEPNPLVRCEPTPPGSPNEMRVITLPAIDALQLRAVADVPIVACNKLDYTCTSPYAMEKTGMDGRAKLTVPANFSGYMQSTERTDFVPAMYFMPALPADDKELPNWPLVPAGAFGGLAIALGTEVDNERGHAMLIVLDCPGTAMAGVSFTSPQADMAATLFYVRDQIPTTSIKETTPEGDGGWANLPPGPVEIIVTDVKTGLVINSVSILVRKGAITTAYIRPLERGAKMTGRFGDAQP